MKTRSKEFSQMALFSSDPNSASFSVFSALSVQIYDYKKYYQYYNCFC